MTKVLYPGSFDPLTKGHMNIIYHASELFDEVVIAVMKNSSKKQGFFTIEERMEMIKEIYKDYNNISVVTGILSARVALDNGCSAIVRGLRNTRDFEDELVLQEGNKRISQNKIQTVCLFGDLEYQILSSSFVRELFSLGEDITDYVDPIVKEEMVKKKSLFK